MTSSSGATHVRDEPKFGDEIAVYWPAVRDENGNGTLHSGQVILVDGADYLVSYDDTDLGLAPLHTKRGRCTLKR